MLRCHGDLCASVNTVCVCVWVCASWPRRREKKRHRHRSKESEWETDKGPGCRQLKWHLWSLALSLCLSICLSITWCDPGQMSVWRREREHCCRFSTREEQSKAGYSVILSLCEVWSMWRYVSALLIFYATPSPVLLSSIKFHHSPFLLLCSNRCLPFSPELEGAEIGGGKEWRGGRKRREWSLLFGCFWEDLHLNSHSSQWSWLVSLLVCRCVFCAKQQKTLFSSSATETLPQSRLCFFLSLSLAVPFVASADYGGLDWFGCVKSQIAQGETCSFHVWSGVWDVNKKCSSLASEDYSFLSSMGSWDHRRWKHQCASRGWLTAC